MFFEFAWSDLVMSSGSSIRVLVVLEADKDWIFSESLKHSAQIILPKGSSEYPLKMQFFLFSMSSHATRQPW